jgi:hypothetical protein
MRYPAAGGGVADADADAFAVAEVVPEAGAEHAAKEPIRMLAAG